MGGEATRSVRGVAISDDRESAAAPKERLGTDFPTDREATRQMDFFSNLLGRMVALPQKGEGFKHVVHEGTVNARAQRHPGDGQAAV